MPPAAYALAVQLRSVVVRVRAGNHQDRVAVLDLDLDLYGGRVTSHRVASACWSLGTWPTAPSHAGAPRPAFYTTAATTAGLFKPLAGQV